jgi:hypothetical protein
VSQQSTNRSFDDLARGLAEGSLSRRRALRLFAGTAIAALIPSRALAEDDDCVRICHVPFDRETGRCFFGQRENRCVPRSRVQVHLESHPCDCRGRCRDCQRPTTTPSTSTSTTSTSTTTSSTTSTSTTTPTTTTSTTTSTTPMCLPNGSSPCTADTQCCSRICDSRSFPDFCSGCRFPGGSCAAGETCCDVGSVDPSTCVNGKCCAPEQRECNDNIPCCPGLMCANIGFGTICLR